MWTTSWSSRSRLYERGDVMLVLVLAIGLAVTFNVALQWAIEQVRWYKQTHYYDGDNNAPYTPDKR